MNARSRSASSQQALLIQRDTFYVVANGKLKLREQDDGAWLIHYRRDDQRELQVSDYTIVPVERSGGYARDAQQTHWVHWPKSASIAR